MVTECEVWSGYGADIGITIFVLVFF